MAFNGTQPTIRQGANPAQPTSPAATVHQHALRVALDSGVPVLVGGAYALQQYTGIARDTKDLDLFVRPSDYERALQTFVRQGFKVELTYPHWLGKAFLGEEFIDIIFNSGNGIVPVDDEWFDFAMDGIVLGQPVKLCPLEETIWSKSWVMERDRYDGADVAHLLLTCSEKLDWSRMLRRFGEDWRVLFSHLVLFGFIYPGERGRVPDWVMRELLARLDAETSTEPPSTRLCRGTLLSQAQYYIDIHKWGFEDVRTARARGGGNSDPSAQREPTQP